MNLNTLKRLILHVLVISLLAGCRKAVPTATPVSLGAGSASATVLPVPDAADSFLAAYRFPDSIDPAKRYLFYLHGKIIEDQGLPAVSPDFGEYEYEAILEKLKSYDFDVISEQRSKDTDSAKYAERVAEQIKALRNAGVPSQSITVVGASKGAGIAAIVSSLLRDSKMNFVLLGFCAPDTVRELVQNRMTLYGNVLAIRDSVDNLSGSCQELFDASDGKGIGRHNEIFLSIGTGHGILYKSLDGWIQPTVQWATDYGRNE
jgi:hypothetical protein